MRSFIIVFLLMIVPAIGCSAKFSTKGLPGQGSQEAPPGPPVDPKPEPVWEGGFIQLRCDLKGADYDFEYARVGMLDAGGAEFLGDSYKWDAVNPDEDFYFVVWADFPGHDATVTPVTKPSHARIKYYIFIRPDWRTPEITHEVSETFLIPFEKDEGFRIRWDFTKYRFYCRVTAPQ